MQNIDVRFNATSNFGKVRADMAALQAQSEALNASFAKGAYAKPPALVDMSAWRNGTNAIDAASDAYRRAASSSGLLTTQQIRGVSESEKYTRALQKQKLGLRDMIKHQGIMKEVYRDQLRMQRMTAQYWGTDTMGRQITDITMPRNVPKDLDTWRRKMGMFGNMAASAGTQVVNLGKNMQWSGRQLMTGFTYPMVLFGAAAGAMAYKVEDAFGKINKVYNVSEKSLNNQAARERELGDLRAKSMDNARKAAERYGLSIESTLDVESQLAASGLNIGNGLLPATNEVQRISAIGGIDPTQTTEMVIALQSAFRKTITDSGDLTGALNFMNAASNASSLSLQDLAEATPRAAASIAQLGGSVKDMGILLVSMREGGVAATEAANGIKSVGTRIINPVPKAIDYYNGLSKTLGNVNIDLEKMRDQSGGNLLNFLKIFGKEEAKIQVINKKTGQVDEKATNIAKARGRAVLFGTYQNNRLSASLTNVVDAYQGLESGQKGYINQTAEVIKLSQQSDKQLEAIADASEKEMTKTGAAKMRKAFQTFKIQLAEIGEPFLKAATQVLNVFTKVLSKFNNLGDGTKKFILLTAIIVAMAGPLIMLGGLFLNLSGQFIKGVGSIAKFIGISKLLTKEEQSAALTTEAVNKAMLKQNSTASTLGAELRVLAESYRMAQQAAQGYLSVTAQQRALPQPAINRQGNPTGFIGPQTMPMPNTAGYGANYRLSGGETRQYAQTDARLASGVRLEQARVRLANEYMAANNQVARDAGFHQQRVAATNRMVERMRGSLNGANLAAGGMAAGMGLMMISSNKTAQNIGKWLLVGSLLVPMLAKALVFGVGLATAAASEAKSRILAAAATSSGLTSMGRMGMLAGGLVGSIKGFGVALNAALGPVGWASLAIVGIAAAIMYTKNQAKKAAEELAARYEDQKQAQEAISNSAERWAKSVDRAVGGYKKLPGILAEVKSGSPKNATELEKSIDYYKNEEVTDAEGNKSMNTVDAYKGLNDDAEKSRQALKMYIDLQVEAGLSAEKAQQRMKAFFIAVGDSAIAADYQSNNLLNTVGDIKNFDWSNIVGNQIDIFKGVDMLGSAKNDAKQAATDLAEVFSNALYNSKTPDAANAIVEQMRGAIDAPWTDYWNRILKNIEAGEGTETKDYFVTEMGKLGIDSAEAFQAKWRELGTDGLMKLLSGGDGTNMGIGGMLTDEYVNIGGLDAAVNSEKAMTDALREFLYLGPEVKDMSDVFDSFAVKAKTLSFAQQQKEIEGMNVAMFNADGTIDPLKRTMAAAAVETYGLAHNIDLSGDYSQDLMNFLHGVTNEAGGAADATNRVSTNLNKLRDKNINIVIKTSQLGGIFQAGIDNVKEHMVDSASYLFDNAQQAIADDAAEAMRVESEALQDRQEAVSNALQDRQEAAMRGLQERQEAVMRAFEERWEKKKDGLNKFYETRIKNIEKTSKAATDADQIRQKLYEKEKKRLSDLADQANTQIDFDVAINTGNLDEAAKLQNNSEAKGMSDQMDKEQQRAEEQTQNLIERLDKKRERLEKARDKALKRLEKVEERMRRSLEKMQEAQQRALQKQQEAQQRALEKTQAAESRALEKRQAQEERASQRQRDLAKQEFDYKMELFKALPAANKKQLEAALKASHLTLKDFGLNTLDGKKGVAGQWGSYFQKYLDQGLRQGAAEAASSNMWENVTDQIARKMLKGFGFSGLPQFEQFVKTGKRGGDSKKPETRHGGGEIGSNDRSSRAGLGGNGLHRTEKMIRAQKGEYIINRKAYAQNRELVRGINSGRVSGSAYRAENRNQEFGTKRRITEGLGGFPVAAMGGADKGFAHYGYGYGSGFAAMIKGMRPGIKSGINEIRERKRAARAARQKAREQQHVGNGSNLPVVPGGPITDLGRNALSWAADHQYGDALGDWYNRCLSFVRQSLGAPGGVVDAKSSWYGAKYKRSAANYSKVPAGVPVFWNTGANGHVILSAGGGKAVGTDNRVQGQALPTTISDVASWLGTPPAGWSADINGKQVYPLRRGGTIKYDNTLINAHKGETVLPARLTEQFKNNVRSNGGDTFQVTLDLRGAMIKEEIDIEKAVYAAIDKRETRQGRRRVVGSANSR